MNDRFLSMFFEEARELLQALEAGLMDLEARQEDREHLDRTFRAAHTLKGAAGMVGLRPIAEFTHKVEAVLDDIRAGRLAVTPGAITILLRAKDHLGDRPGRGRRGPDDGGPGRPGRGTRGPQGGADRGRVAARARRAVTGSSSTAPADARSRARGACPRERADGPGRWDVAPLSDRVSPPARSPPQGDRPPRVPRRAARAGRCTGHGPCRCASRPWRS